MARKRWIAASCFASAASLVACSGGETDPLTVPDTRTAWVFFGTAQSGRAVSPQDITVARASEVLDLRPTSIGGGDIDMFFAGLEEQDLPEGVDPATLSFVPESDARAHRMFVLHDPHVMERPRPSESPAPLVPVEIDNHTISDERRRRLDVLLRGIAVRDPCLEPAAEIGVVAPRTSGEDVRSMRTLSSGDTWISFSATSTAIAGVIRPGAIDLDEVIGLPTGAMMVSRDEKIRVNDLGDREAIDAGGRVVPANMTMNFLGAFGGIGVHMAFDPQTKRWVDDTPRLDDPQIVPGLLIGVRHAELDGVGSLCTFGNALGPNQVAGLYCRAETSTVWTASAAFRGQLIMQSLIAREGAPPIATDLGGTIYEHRDGRWDALYRPAINDGCSPPCATFEKIAVPRGPDDKFAVLGGSQAEVIVLRDRDGEIEVRSIEAVAGVLFKDERRGGDHALVTTGVTISPDGAIWMGTGEQILVRVAPDLESAQRICLPKDARGGIVSAIEAHPDGRLIIGMAPALLAFGRWDQ